MTRNRRSSYRRASAANWRIRFLPSLAILVIGMALAALSGGFAYFLPAIITGVQATGQPGAISLPSPLSPSGTPVAAQGAFTVLLLGSDDDTKFDPAHVLTQSMILVRVDPASKSVTMLSIPRDLWVPLSTGGTAKIDGAYSYGGADAAVATVSRNFHVHIDEFVWVGLKGLIKLIDALGGVDIVASNPVNDDYYPADLGGNPYGYERVAVLPGPQHLTGINALQYVRSRHGDLVGDFGRSQRQQQVLIAIRQKAKQLNATDIPDLALTFSGELKTSMGIARVRELLPLAGSLDNPGAIRQIVLLSPYTEIGNVDSQSVVLPHWDLILPLVRQYFP
jgi:LCP family protein required for cell wall assembly